jgi:hypothetical protein
VDVGKTGVGALDVGVDGGNVGKAVGVAVGRSTVREAPSCTISTPLPRIVQARRLTTLSAIAICRTKLDGRASRLAIPVVPRLGPLGKHAPADVPGPAALQAIGQRKMEGRALAEDTIDPDVPAMRLDKRLDDRQPYTCLS